MAKHRFAVLGCGRIAPRHFESISQIKDAELAACVDIKFDRAEAFGKKYGVKAFRSLEDLLKWGEFDVLTVCTPSGLHAEHSIAAMNSKKHVVVEKPMALRLQDADLMIEASQKNKVRLFVVKQNRYNLPVVALRQALELGRF